MKIAFFDAKPYDLPHFEREGAKHGIKFHYFETKLGPDTAGLAKGFDGVCAFVNDVISAKVIDRLSDLGIRVIALRSAGFNHVDMKHAFGKIHILRVPAYSPQSIAEHTFALILTSIRRIHKAYNRTREFNFSLSGLEGFDLFGKTLGVIGTGKIGREVLRIGAGFGMKILAFDPFPDQTLETKFGIQYVSLDEIFSQSDILTLHCPLTEETRHLLCRESLSRCKKGVVIVNTSRGALIDSAALLEAIKSRQVGAACLDVYEEESEFFFEDFSGHILDDDVLARLISMPNVIVTSHQAFLTEEALDQIAKTTAESLAEFFRKGFSATEICYRGCVTEDTRGTPCF